MGMWTLSTTEKKNIEEITVWALGEESVTRTEWFRWGSWTLCSDEPPDVDLDNPDGYDVWGSGLDWQLVDMTDGVAVFWEWPSSMSVMDQEQFKELYDQEGPEGPTSLGWEFVNTEHYLHGKLELT